MPKLGILVEPHRADWKGLGNIAGPARNREMVEAGADLCVALHRRLEASKGTKDCVRQALAAGIPVYLIEDERAIPRRCRPGTRGLRRSRERASVGIAGPGGFELRDHPAMMSEIRPGYDA